jgi:hypothetical protein
MKYREATQKVEWVENLNDNLHHCYLLQLLPCTSRKRLFRWPQSDKT